MSAVKIQERSRTDLRHDEVDDHFLAGKKIKDSMVVGGLGAIEQCRR